MARNEKIELDENRIINYYNDGLLYKEMAEKEGVTISKIQRDITRLKKQGKIKERENTRYNPNPKKDLNLNEIVNLFKNGKSHKKIADKYDVSEKTIRENLKEWFKENSTIEEYNKIIESNRNSAFNLSKANLPKDELIKMKNSGMSNRAIGRHFGVAHSTVAKELDRIGGENYAS